MCNAAPIDNGKGQRDVVTYLACSKHTYLLIVNTLFCDKWMSKSNIILYRGMDTNL